MAQNAMDAFENVVSEILWRDGYWVQNAVKVELTREEKVEIGRPTIPRPELDVVGYRGKRKELLVVECKSYLDSRGITYNGVAGRNSRGASRYKLFNDETLQRVVFNRLSRQMYEAELVTKNPNIRLALVCGKIATERDRLLLRDHFEERDWLLWDQVWLREKLSLMSKGGYENSAVAVVSKLLLRG